MKNYLLLPLTLFIISMIACNSSDPIENMKRDLDIYIQAYNDAEYEKMLDMLYPTYFNLYPRKQVFEEMGLIRAEYGNMSMPKYVINNIMDTVAFHDTLYTVVDFEFDMKNVLTAKAYSGRRMLIPQFLESYKDKDVKVADDSTYITAHDKTSMVGVSVNGGKNWQFVDHRDNPMDGRTSSKCLSPAVWVVIMQKYKETVLDKQ